ncbi:MAG: FAD-dependent oxidoreductase [Fimbriimonadaceae bacterium]
MSNKPVVVNDIHSKLNPTVVGNISSPETESDLLEVIEKSKRIAVCGGRHSMGGQQFLSDETLVDMSRLNMVSVNADSCIARIGAGAQWPEINEALLEAQNGNQFRLTYRQKQTGGDRLSIGGSLSSNIHTRGLSFAPFVEDIEAFRMVLANGEVVTVSRTENSELFSLAVGGYGLFGVVSYIDLRLVRRHKLRREVEIRRSEGLMSAIDDKVKEGYEYGDFQFAIDAKSEDFLDNGVFACYLPVSDETPIGNSKISVPRRAWHELVYMAHEKKSEAFRLYCDFYKKSSGQIYWSDTHQMTPYLDHYHEKLDRRLGAKCAGSEMITELYVRREDFEVFMSATRDYLRAENANVIYGTVRVVEVDSETFLAWAKERWACIIINLHVDHDEMGLERAKSQFRGLIDIAQQFGGSYYLTYHPWASHEQILKSYPQIPEFFAKKVAYDPLLKFASNWYDLMSRLIQ